MLKTVLIGSLPFCSVFVDELNKATKLMGLFLTNASHKCFDKNRYECPIYTDGIDKVSAFLKAYQIDVVFVGGLSSRVPLELMKIPTYGFLNIHPGKLPNNRGADPIFWSIKNAEKETSISIHKMDANFDTGPILYEKKIPIILGETYGMLNSKIILNSTGIVGEVLSKIEVSSNYKVQQEINATYNLKPDKELLHINWEAQIADDIEFLVNACNPRYGGATTYYHGGEIKILEVSQVTGQQPLFGRTAGEIVHAHPIEGLYVVCKYGQLLKVKTMSTDAGVLSGEKYVSLGMQVGQKFSTEIREYQT